MKKKQELPKRHKRWLRVLLGVMSGAFALAAIAALAVGLYVEHSYELTAPMELFSNAAEDAPPRFFVYDFQDRTNRVGEAEELTEGVFSQGTPTVISISDAPDVLQKAFVAIEDKRFYRHRGVDWYRTAAAAVSYLTGASDRFGASTITQQTVKNVTGDNEVSLRRKLQEILYALDLERALEKSEILELYLNVIPFSNGCIGVASAAELYFSKAVGELTPAEAAAIAAVTNNPSYYDPLRHPEHTLKRRDLILLQMREQGYLDEAAYAAAVSSPLGLVPSGKGAPEQVRSWYVDMVLEDVISDLCSTYGMTRAAASRMLHTKGLRIELAMDPQLQSAVEEYYAKVIQTPKNSKGESAQSAIIVIHPETGDVLAVAGAIGQKQGNRLQNFATQTLRPPGSAVKPITVFAPALERGIIHWASVYDDVPVNFGKSGNAPWPANASGTYRGLTNIAYAVTHSTNTVAVRVLQELGLRTAFDFAKNECGLESMIDRHGVTDCDLAALALGQFNYGVTLRELTAAYGIFADGGSFHGHRSYYRVIAADGELLLSAPDTARRVLSSGNAAIMTKLMQRTVKEGTASALTLDAITECAGKTGTTQNDGDRWFIGYTPELICGVWCGFEYPEPITGGNPCLGIWDAVMTRICQAGSDHSKFSVPQELVQVSYCRDSGELSDDACLFDPRGDRSETGWFVVGTEPRHSCSCHILVACDADGGVSHGHCPEEQLTRAALIRVTRHFPMQITVTDAQYAWRGDPRSMATDLQEHEAYFEAALPDFCGRSRTDCPFNRSCTRHSALPFPPRQESVTDEPESSSDAPMPPGTAPPWGNATEPAETEEWETAERSTRRRGASA